MLKKCSKCEKEKIVSEFFRAYNQPEDKLCGYRQPCIKCTGDDRRHYNEQWLSTSQGRASKKLSAAQNYKRNSATRIHNQWVTRLRTWYKITTDEYAWLFSEQNGCCALCHEPPQKDSRYGEIRRLAIDHWHGHPHKKYHACKKCIRGLLCDRCNRHFLYRVEAYPHLQNDVVKAYLSRRPFCIASEAFADASLSEMCK